VDEDDELNLIGDLTIRVEMIEETLKKLGAPARSDTDGC